eukprot:3139545-Rhodomonas_salina.1
MSLQRRRLPLRSVCATGSFVSTARTPPSQHPTPRIGRHIAYRPTAPYCMSGPAIVLEDSILLYVSTGDRVGRQHPTVCQYWRSRTALVGSGLFVPGVALQLRAGRSVRQKCLGEARPISVPDIA